MTDRGDNRRDKVLYVSTLMGPETCSRLFAGAKFPPSQAAQKYHRLMASGLAANGAEVTALSAPPLSRTTGGRRFLRLPGETWNGVRLCYLPVVDLPVIKRLTTTLAAFLTAFFAIGRNTFVLCDGLNISVCAGARAAARLRRRPCAAIVTDVPSLLAGERPGLTARVNMRLLAGFDGYVLLTEAMSALVNPKERPYLVMEGQCDGAMAARENRLSEKTPGKVCLYAGMLHRIYGVCTLTEAFSRLTDPEARLVLYGAGDAVSDIQEAARRDRRIEYRGVADNAAVVDAEMRATLLINPRPSGEAYTKYSFPSKNLEYMASGTPVLTTRLPGMPEEYNACVYRFERETAEGMAETLGRVLALPRDVLHETGLRARAFVLEQKNHTAQAARVLTFLKGLADA